MGRVTIEDRIYEIYAYCEGSCSFKDAFLAHREFIGQHNLPTERKALKWFHILKGNGSGADVKTSLRTCILCSDEEYAAVCQSVTDHPSPTFFIAHQNGTITKQCYIELDESFVSTVLQIRLTQEKRPIIVRSALYPSIGGRCKAKPKMIKSQKSSLVMKLIFTLVDPLLNRIVPWRGKKFPAGLLRIHCIHKNGLFDVYSLLKKSLSCISSKLIPKLCWSDKQGILCHEQQLFEASIECNGCWRFWFQHDGATWHTSNARMAVLKGKFPNHIISRSTKVNWAHISCALTALDISPSGYLNTGSMFASKYQLDRWKMR